MIDGVAVTLDGRAYVAAPLNFAALQKYGDFITSIAGHFTIKDIPQVAGIIGASLRRNHPELTDEFLMENIDLRNARDLLGAVLGASGGKQVDDEEGATQGEA